MFHHPLRDALAGLALLVGAQAGAGEPPNAEALRAQALQLVNEARQAEGLAPLRRTPELERAAQAHAEDMLRRDYLAHQSPEGGTLRDRYVAAGGSPLGLVAENVGRCTGCGPEVEPTRIRHFHEGWMQSPSHRENILRPGLDFFGFGIAASGEQRQIVVVQTFAGPPRQ